MFSANIIDFDLFSKYLLIRLLTVIISLRLLAVLIGLNSILYPPSQYDRYIVMVGQFLKGELPWTPFLNVFGGSFQLFFVNSTMIEKR